MATDPYAEFQQPAKPQAAANDPYAEFQQPAAPSVSTQQQPEQAGFGKSLYDATVGPVAGLASNYYHHVQENQPKYGLLAGFPAMGQTALDVGSGITNGFMDAAKKTGSAIAAGQPLKALQQAPGMVPLVGPTAVKAGEQVDAGNYGGALGTSAGLLSSVAGPPMLGKVGAGLQRAAEPVAESALGIRAVNRAYGRTPGRAALDETSGVRPGTVADSAQSRLGEINKSLEAKAAQSTTPVDLNKPLGVIDNATQKAQMQNASKTIGQLEPMKQHLTTPVQGYPGATTASGQIAPLQSASDALALKRGFGNEFIHNWNPETMSGVKGTAAQAYHALDSELDKAVPEGAELNRRSSSLIPVAQRAEARELQAPIGQRILGRFGAHTGALAGSLMGYHAGGVPGAMMGLALPEIAASPTVQMIGARTLNGAGKALQAPLMTNSAKALPLLPKKSNKAE